MSLKLMGMEPAQVAAVRRAVKLLRRVVPEEYDRLVREIRSIGFGKDGCGVHAIACTAGNFGRHINLVDPPESLGDIELAVVLSHEARHHWTGPDGRDHIIRHTCVDCTDPAQRATDAIYLRDREIRSRLTGHIHLERMRMQSHPNAFKPRQKTAGRGVLAASAVVFGAGLLAWAADRWFDSRRTT